MHRWANPDKAGLSTGERHEGPTRPIVGGWFGGFNLAYSTFFVPYPYLSDKTRHREIVFRRKSAVSTDSGIPVG